MYDDFAEHEESADEIDDERESPGDILNGDDDSAEDSVDEQPPSDTCLVCTVGKG